MSFNRESDSVTVGAPVQHFWDLEEKECFNRESDSVTVGAALHVLRVSIAAVSIAKAIPSLLERSATGLASPPRKVSIAKAIPSLLEPRDRIKRYKAQNSFNRESDSVTVGAYIGLMTADGKVQVSIAKAIPSLLEQRYPAQRG